MVAGFNDYAHLRLRGHHPGNGRYDLPPTLGPNSGSTMRSILGKCPPPQADTCEAGPGEYVIPTTIGTGRSTRFGPPLEVDAAGNPVLPVKTTAPGDASGKGTPWSPSPLPKQYSMALEADTPAKSIHGRMKSEWAKSTTGHIGPGEYDVPTTFYRRSWGVQPGAHFGVRTVSAAETATKSIPGPGSYNVKRFGDDVSKPRNYVTSVRRRKQVEVTPGPGAYDDPTTIAHRTLVPRMRLNKASTFSGRWDGRRSRTCGPGPAAYHTTEAEKLLERNRRHAPRFPKCVNAIERMPSAAPGPGPVPPFYALPSDFGYDCRKGKSMLFKPSESNRGATSVGPGQYDVSSSRPSPKGGRFASASFEQYAADRAESATKPGQGTNDSTGPGSYVINYASVEPRADRWTMAFVPSARESDPHSSVPGPGHYSPLYSCRERTALGTVFHKGDYSRGALHQAHLGGDGPGAYYNDDAMYSSSIQGDTAAGKGFTFGIRYPARATHQACRPRDETTNINCEYPDEVLSYTFQPKRPLTQKGSTQQP